MGIKNILEADGFAIALLGLTIVFLALVLISTMIACLPRALSVIDGILPGEFRSHDAANSEEAGLREEEAIAAAIAFALHQTQYGSERHE